MPTNSNPGLRAINGAWNTLPDIPNESIAVFMAGIDSY
jgi:hypothetical protein